MSRGTPYLLIATLAVSVLAGVLSSSDADPRTPHGFDYATSPAKEVVFSSSRDVEQNVEYSDVTVFPGTSTAFAARLSVKNSHTCGARSPLRSRTSADFTDSTTAQQAERTVHATPAPSANPVTSSHGRGRPSSRARKIHAVAAPKPNTHAAIHSCEVVRPVSSWGSGTTED